MIMCDPCKRGKYKVASKEQKHLNCTKVPSNTDVNRCGQKSKTLS